MFKKFWITLLMLMPGIASAAANMFDPVAEDKSLVVLRSVFGGLGAFGPGADPFGEGIKIFNAAVLIIGGLLVAYTIIVGTVGTAHDGEMLGKKFSSVWIPIRTALGTALVLPVINGTYCIMQAIVAWLIVQGVGLADKVWTAYTTDTTMAFVSSKGMNSTSARSLGYGVFKSVACMHTITQTVKDIKLSPHAVAVKDQVGTMSSSLIPGRILFGGMPDGNNGIGKDSCGSVDLPKISLVKPTTGLGNIGPPGMSVINIADLPQGLQIIEANKVITEANEKATKELITDLDKLAEKMVTSKVVITSQEIDTVINKYETTVNTVAATEVQKLSDFKTLAVNASKDGWYMAGAFYVKLAWFADTVHRASSNVGTSNPGNFAIFQSSSLKDNVQPYAELIAKMSSTGTDSLPGGFGINAEATETSGVDALFSKVFKYNPIVLDKGEHPLMALKRIGNWLLGIYATIITVTVGLSGASAGWASKVITQVVTLGVFDAEKALDVFVTFLMPLTTPMFAIGVILSYVLPMMPFFLWFGATLGWVVMCIEAILAAPMWAVMHVTASGDEMVGSGSQGYKLVLSLILRPVLMIFGLVASFVIIQVVGDILTEVFFGVFAIGQSDGNIILKVIGYLIVAPLMYAWTMFVLIQKAFSMIHVIPEELLKWFGGTSSQQLGDFANTVGGEGRGAMAGAALMSSQANRMTGELTGSAIGKRKDAAGKNAEAESKFKSLTGGMSFDQAKEGDANFSKLGLRDKMNINQKLESALEQFGGRDTAAGQAFMAEFNDKIGDDNTTSSQAIDSATQKGNEAMYGQGASQFIGAMGQNISGGQSQAQALLSNKYKKLEKAGLTHSQITDKMSGMMSSAMARFNNREIGENGKPLSFSTIVGQESDKLNQEMALGQGYSAEPINQASEIKSKVEETSPNPVDNPDIGLSSSSDNSVINNQSPSAQDPDRL